MISILAATAMFTSSQEFPAAPIAKDRFFYIFLNKGPKRSILASMPEKQVNEMLAKHLANFGRLDGLGKLLFVGPLGDDGFIRGIIAVRANSKSDLPLYFSEDTFIIHETLAYDAYEMKRATWNQVNFSAKTTMVNNSLILIKKGPKWTKGLSNSKYTLLPSEPDWLKSRALAFASQLIGSDANLCGLLYFHTTKLAEAQELVQKDPLIQGGIYVAEGHPQFMASRFYNRP